MSVIRLFCISVLAALGGIAAAQEPKLFAVTRTDRAAVAGLSQLFVRTDGSVKISGTSRRDILWTVKVTSEDSGASAQRDADAVRPVRRGSMLMLSGPRDHRADFTLEVPVDSVEIYTQTQDGAINIYGIHRPVRAESGGGPIVLDQIHGTVLAQTAAGRVDLGTIHGTVKCVTGGGPIRATAILGEARLASGGGDITAHKVSGTLTASTAGGAIKIDEAGSAVIADTQGGNIEVGSARGVVTAKNSAGPIQVNNARGVFCESASGAIRLANVSGALRATTALGSIQAHLSTLAGESFLTTGNGDITVLIPSNLSLTIRAQNELADSVRRIVTEFPAILVQRKGGLVVAEGALNGGGPVLNISGTRGTIFIRRVQ